MRDGTGLRFDLRAAMAPVLLALALTAQANIGAPQEPPPAKTPAPQKPTQPPPEKTAKTAAITSKTAAAKTPTTSATAPRAIDWSDLLPAQEREHYSATPPAPVHDYLSGESGLAAQQPLNFNVNTALEGEWVKLPGFIVPLELDAEGKVTEFFLVPYYGACIHVPPPPANQMAYVVLKKGVTLDSLYAAFWVTGQLSTARKATKLGSAAYTIAATQLDDYQY